jgi:hypothetical protein
MVDQAVTLIHIQHQIPVLVVMPDLIVLVVELVLLD